MNHRGEMLIVHIRGSHLVWNGHDWRPTATTFTTIAALHVRMNYKSAVLATTLYSCIIFSPEKVESNNLQGIHSHLLKKPGQVRQFACDCIKKRMSSHSA